MSESDLVKAIQDRVKELSKRHPIWATKIVGHGRQKRGLPDLRVVFYGLSLDVETKFGDNKATPAQEQSLRQIRFAGGSAIVCRSVREFDDALRRLLVLAGRFSYCTACRAPAVPPSAKFTTCEHCGYRSDYWFEARGEL